MQRHKHPTMIPPKTFYDAVNPPLPTTTSTSFDSKSGQRLLSLLKTYDKQKQQQQQQQLRNENDEENSIDMDDHDEASEIDAVVDEIVNILHQLTIVVQHQGLLRRNSNNRSSSTSTAKHVLDSMSTTKQPNSTGGGKKKRKVNHHQPSQQRILLDDMVGAGTIDGMTTNTSTTTTADVQLLMLSVIRIIENYHDRDVDRWIYTTTTDLITATCQYNAVQQQLMNPNNPVDLCFLAEYELIASSCKSLLSGIEQYIRQNCSVTHSAAAATTTTTTTTHDENESLPRDQDYVQVIDYSIASSFRAVTSMIALLGNKLFITRNNNNANSIGTIIKKLQEMAWQIVFQVPPPLQQPRCRTCTSHKAAIIFLTTIPYAAAARAAASANKNLENNNHHPTTAGISMSWNQIWVDATCVLFYMLQQLPVEKHRNDNTQDSMDDYCMKQLSESVKQTVLHQLQSKDDSDEDIRVEHLLQTIQSLVTMLITLLTREYIPSLSSGIINCEINIDVVLTIIDTMISLPSLGESKYYSTKKRLRNETMTATGCGSTLSFSPLCIVTKLAVPIRLIGYELFNITITSLGSMNLSPFVRRIMKIIGQNVVSSASNSVRHISDPTAMMFGWNNNNKRGERWLHTSIISRTASIRSFQTYLRTFGIDLQQLTLNTNMNNKNGNRSSHVESSIRIICATIIEELSLKKSNGDADSDDDWGTWNDRLKLVSTTVTTLTACLNCGGSFLTPTIRDLIDMVAATLLSSIVHAHPMTAFGEMKCSILQLGIAVLCTPWQDGATSTIASEFVSAAQSCVQDSNETVVATAVAFLNVCSALHCSRLPPLNVITRPNNFLSDYASTAITAENIEDKLRSTREEMNRVKSNSVEKAKASESKKEKSDLAANKTKTALEGSTIPKSDSTIHSLPVVDDDKMLPGNLLLEKESSQQVQDQPSDSRPRDPVFAKLQESLTEPFDSNMKTDVDDDFPVIVDCGPDEDDV